MKVLIQRTIRPFRKYYWQIGYDSGPVYGGDSFFIWSAKFSAKRAARRYGRFVRKYARELDPDFAVVYEGSTI